IIVNPQQMKQSNTNLAKLNLLFINIPYYTFDILPNSSIKQTIRPYIQKVQVITDKVDNRLKFVEYTLEYINNGDMIQVLLKLGKETLEDFAFKKGLEISKDIALIVMKSVPKGKTPLGIVILLLEA
ncbi:hypothetical protein K9088_001760, partial [Campylobacter jejuni]|nr:hypothetical protein [Campylobacter jejuni]